MNSSFRNALLGVMFLMATFAFSEVSLQRIAAGLPDVVGIENAGDGSGRLFIVLQGGQIVIYDGTSVQPNSFLDIGSLVTCCGEQGLLGLAFHPNFENNGFFYVNYTNKTGVGDTVIARYTATKSNPNLTYFDIANPNSALVLLTYPQPFSNHNGGSLAFGPDGYLYAGSGDGGSGGDPQNNGQSKNTFLGKILRLDVNGSAPYIPASNPFVSDPNAKGQIWAYGLRNPWRISFDRQTGDLLIGDVGQNDWEEVDFQPAGSAGGQNYGWRKMEGRHCFNPAINCNDGTLTFPVLEYDHGEGRCAVTGGYRYRGNQVAELFGAYIYGDYCSGQIFAANQNCSGTWVTKEILQSGLLISTFGQDENGEVYVANHPGGDGEIYKIVGSSQTQFSDDFEDNNVSDWTFNSGTWSGIAGNLVGTVTKKGNAFPMLFGACSQCTFETTLSPETDGARVSLLGWYQDSKNYVEVTFLEAKDKVQFKEHSAGKVVNKKSAKVTLNTGVSHLVKLAYDGFTYTLFVDSNPTPLVSLCPKSLPSGTVGFRVKGMASFQYVTVN